MQYPDLPSAGRELAATLGEFAGRQDVVVLGIVRGGVLAALEVAQLLDLPLDLLLLRPLIQGPAGNSVRAARVAGVEVLEDGLSAVLSGSRSIERSFVEDGLRALAVREEECRGDRPHASIAGKTVILIDCGMRTGGTMRASARAARKAGASHIVAAVPIAPPDALAMDDGVADRWICLSRPPSLGHVGLAYALFAVPTESQIRQALADHDARVPTN